MIGMGNYYEKWTGLSCRQNMPKKEELHLMNGRFERKERNEKQGSELRN
jgi:hypothetical protein